jgi:hypothetical protein
VADQARAVRQLNSVQQMDTVHVRKAERAGVGVPGRLQAEMMVHEEVISGQGLGQVKG